MEIWIGVREIFDGCPGDMSSMSWRYVISVLEILDGYPGDIHRCPGDI